ncbi:uncharacterized protein A4U43_C02F18020 [Asparagus officinalis]|uniref:Uncharacterized protein n=1 Tax=Asparagus officinalis TaxID=4686 RepID=A0A5P1FP01_ASPOF|nr:uncharacterized protein A4U43_C02F18020 [Asparagus officinalis]
MKDAAIEAERKEVQKKKKSEKGTVGRGRKEEGVVHSAPKRASSVFRKTELDGEVVGWAAVAARVGLEEWWVVRLIFGFDPSAPAVVSARVWRWLRRDGRAGRGAGERKRGEVWSQALRGRWLMKSILVCGLCVQSVMEISQGGWGRAKEDIVKQLRGGCCLAKYRGMEARW